jgi:hypothetical protein
MEYTGKSAKCAMDSQREKIGIPAKKLGNDAGRSPGLSTHASSPGIAIDLWS